MIYGFGGSGEAICRLIQNNTKYLKSQWFQKKKPKDFKKNIKL